MTWESRRLGKVEECSDHSPGNVGGKVSLSSNVEAE